MSSVVDTTATATAPGSATPHVLTPGAAAIVPNPLSHRLRVRQRLGPHVYLADSLVTAADTVTNSTNSNTTSFAPPQVVLKIGRLLRPWEQAVSANAPANASAWQELRVARQLHATEGHRHIVRTHEVHVENRLSFLVLEYCAGGDLFSHVTHSPGGCLPVPEALQKLRQIASGVQFLHDQNLAHRDLSLENILLHEGECKICDFGLSTRADERAKDVVGKTAYAAPEVVQGEWYDPVRADVWSLGVVLFMMLTGSPLVPFASPGCAEFKALKAVGIRGVLSAWGLETQFSAATIDLLTRLLEIRPDDRMANTRELLEHPAMLAAAAAAVRDPPRDLTQL